MDIVKLLPLLYTKFIVFTLIFTRLSAMLTTFVLFKRDLITARVIVALSTILAMIILLLNPSWQVHYEIFSMTMMLQALYQVLIGLMTALMLNIVFEIFVSSGQIISTQVGLSTASLIDPRFGYITSLTSFYMLTTTILFLGLNGHLYAIKALMDSFNVIPIYQDFVPSALLTQIVEYSGVMFKGAATLSLMVMIVLLLTNISLAIMTKFAPQFNLFSIGLNMQMIMGLFFIYITYRFYLDGSVRIIQEALDYLQVHFIKPN